MRRITIDEDVLWAEAAAWRRISTWAYVIEHQPATATVEDLYACVLEEKETVAHVVARKSVPPVNVTQPGEGESFRNFSDPEVRRSGDENVGTLPTEQYQRSDLLQLERQVRRPSREQYTETETGVLVQIQD